MKTSISAIYENGVFRPTMPVELPEHCHVEVTVCTSSDTVGKKPLERLAQIASEHPAESNLPTDLAAEHDHYLYGTPKRP